LRGLATPQTEKASVGPHQTCCLREGFEGAEPSAPPIIRVILVFAVRGFEARAGRDLLLVLLLATFVAWGWRPGY
jgi:hypothetical protein